MTETSSLQKLRGVFTASGTDTGQRVNNVLAGFQQRCKSLGLASGEVLPSPAKGSQAIRAPEEAGHGSAVGRGKGEQESAIEEAVRLLTRCLGCERAAVAGRPV